MNSNIVRTRSFQLYLLILIFGCALGLVSCEAAVGLFDGPRDVELSTVQSEYSFDPTTVQQAIIAGHPNLFKLEWERNLQINSETRPTQSIETATPALGTLPIAWSEADFERVINASIVSARKEQLKGLNWYLLRFRTRCQDADTGPQEMTFHFLKIISRQENEHFLRGFVSVNLETGRVTWVESELAQLGNLRQALDRGPSYIPAQMALKIAENSGGAAFRQLSANACQISGVISESVANSEWQLSYEQTEAPFRRLEFQIDKQTGKAKLINTPSP